MENSEENVIEETEIPSITFVSEDKISTTEKKSISEQQESTRSTLAIWLVIALFFTYLVSFLLFFIVIWFPPEKEEDAFTKIKDVITLLITTQTGLVGSALGFYFGTRHKD